MRLFMVLHFYPLSIQQDKVDGSLTPTGDGARVLGEEPEWAPSVGNC